MKVLIAEDSMVMQELLKSFLREWHYEFQIAVDGQQAWEMFQSGQFSLVLTDWIMPNLDGLELIRLIRSRTAQNYVYIILLTSKSEKVDLIQAMEVGADDFLVKPCDKDELRVRLREGERIITLEQSLAEQNRKLRETQAALVESEKLASLGQLAAGMAHEINNPIAFVSNNLSVLKRDVQSLVQLVNLYQGGQTDLQEKNPQLAAEIAQFAEECDVPWLDENLPRMFESSLKGIGRVRDIVNNLRDFARLDEAEMDNVDINHLLESTVKILQHEVSSKAIDVVYDFEELPKVHCGPGKINQVLHNVLLNAIQASEPGSEIRLRTRKLDDAVRIECEDQGSGIQQHDLTHVFEPFFTTKPVGSGTGLGLAVSYGIIRDHGGTIEIESQVGQGTLVRIRLPLRPPKQEPLH
jgi:signal transduction histidine kinase